MNLPQVKFIGAAAEISIHVQLGKKYLKYGAAAASLDPWFLQGLCSMLPS